MSITLETFGQRVKWLLKRPEVDMSQKELAAALGVSEQFLSALIRGKSKPNVYHVRQIARLLDTSVGFLTLETDNPAPPDDEEPDSGAGVTEEAQRIAELVDLLPAWRRQEVLTWLESAVSISPAARSEAHQAAAVLIQALGLDGALSPRAVLMIENALLRYIAGNATGEESLPPMADRQPPVARKRARKRTPPAL